MGNQDTAKGGRKMSSDNAGSRVAVKSNQDAVSNQAGLNPGDKPFIHVIYYDEYHYCKVYNTRGTEVFKFDMRNDAVGQGIGHDGKCPFGDYQLGTPRKEDKSEFGPFFIPVRDIDANGQLHRHKRAGIGIHGGGSGLVNSFAPRQGWVKTDGCFRMQNEDLIELADYVNHNLDVGNLVFFTNRPN